MRLALLNACEGARPSRADPFVGVAQHLVQQGIPAVIAMQFEITDQAAIALAHEFYSALADNYGVDAALSEARKALYAAGNDIEWGTPVLYMRAQSGQLFALAVPAAQPLVMREVTKPEGDKPTPHADHLPGRSEAVRKVVSTVPYWRRPGWLARLFLLLFLVGVVILVLKLPDLVPQRGGSTTLPPTQAVSAPAGSSTAPAAVAETAMPAVTTGPAVVQPTARSQPFGLSTLGQVQERGRVICVGSANLPGFGFVDELGNFSGFDIDFCKAVAAAIFGDAMAFEIRPTAELERFIVLSSGEGDVVFRNTALTMSRDTDLGANFGPVTFYDNLGIMVRKYSDMATLQDLDGASICVQTGTTTELNLADQMAAAGITYELVVFETVDEVSTAYEEERCDAWATDKSGLVARHSMLAEPDAHMIMETTLIKEPLAPMVRHSDDQWLDIITWIVYAIILAEEQGVMAANVDDMRANSQNPDVRLLLGVEGNFGENLGLSNDWAYNIIKLVGNYGEIYNRNLGPDTVFNLPRGLNALYTEGGLIYAPPMR